MSPPRVPPTIAPTDVPLPSPCMEEIARWYQPGRSLTFEDFIYLSPPDQPLALLLQFRNIISQLHEQHAVSLPIRTWAIRAGGVHG